MSSSDIQAQVGRALVDFAVESQYPDEEDVGAAKVESSALPTALDLLNVARVDLENSIRETSREEAPNVDAWIENAKTLQFDIESSKRLANDIIRKAEEDEQREKLLKEQEIHASFLEAEVAFNAQLREALQLIQEVYRNLEKAEVLAHKRQVLDALDLLGRAWALITKIPINRSAQVVRLLDSRCFDLRKTANDLLRSIWENLIAVDYDNREITINKELDGEATNIDAALVSMQAYRQVEDEAKEFWGQLNDVILRPRLNLLQQPLHSIHIEENTIRVGNEAVDPTIKSLFLTIEAVVQFLVDKLPKEFIKPLSDAMMPDLSTQLKEAWLDTAVPVSLDDMVELQKTLAQVQDFAAKLRSLSWPGVEIFNEWIADAPKNWITKKRETSLDWTRNQLALGVGIPQSAEHFERRMVSREEGQQITSTGHMVTQEWDAAWDEEEEEDPLPGTNRASVEEHRRASELSSAAATPATDDDDAAEAWGWNDDDAGDEPQSAVEPTQTPLAPETREVTLSESYQTSSMPYPVLKTVVGIFNDGARLTGPEFKHVPITPAAPALFSLPTLVLATYRSVSPYYYAQHQIGNMFTYNDSIWLCDKLDEFQLEWAKRTDLSPRAYGRVKLDSEIKNLKSFGKRAYTNELNAQRTVISDLLGGANNFFQQDGNLKGELEADVKGVVIFIRDVAASWKPILAYSAWASSVGSLVNSVAGKIVGDVFELQDVSVDEAERIATIISLIIELDNLFLPSVDPNAPTPPTANGDEDLIPMTAQFADKWMRLKFLSEVMQSNLSDIKYFWFESDLSLYFTADEVINLINLSFENNLNVRQAKKEIKERPVERRQ